MGVGTSLGKTFDDLFHFHQNQFDPEKFPAHDEEKSDIEKSVDKAVSGRSADVDQDLIRNPLETSIGNPKMEMTPDQMMIQKAVGQDPSNIYNDSGEIVDTDMKVMNHMLPSFQPMNLIQPESTYNEIDALADK